MSPEIFIPALLVAGLAGYFIRKLQLSVKIGSIENKARRLIEEAEVKEKEFVVQAKAKALEITEAAKKEEAEYRQRMLRSEERVEKRETELDQKLDRLERERKALDDKTKAVDAAKAEIEVLKQEQVTKLEKVAGLSREEAKTSLLTSTEQNIKEELTALNRKLILQARDEAERRARDLITQAMERVASDVTAEMTTTTIQLTNEEMKGRIIGKEGRNIKAFEQLTGVEVIVDDTPDTVILSGFNAIRRHIAKLTLEKLLKDGRIHPARIEEVYEKTKQEVSESVREAGEEAVHDLGIINFPPKLVHLVGRLKFRTSYGQNMLQHSLEMAKIATIMAEELGADVNIVKQGALLHDIGKALDQEIEGTHVEIGKRIAEKFNLDPKVVNAIESHHYDTDVGQGKVEHQSIEAAIVDVADAISSSRPGARRDSFENYVKRLEELENLAKGFEGVEKSYAVQAGREIRVFVIPDQVDDWAATKLAKDLANKIESELKYPGEIKVNVIRERRIIEYAR